MRRVLPGWKGRPGRAEVEPDRERMVATRKRREAAVAMARIDRSRKEERIGDLSVRVRRKKAFV